MTLHGWGLKVLLLAIIPVPQSVHEFEIIQIIICVKAYFELVANDEDQRFFLKKYYAGKHNSNQW